MCKCKVLSVIYFNYACSEIKEQRVRDAIEAVVHCDVNKDPVVDCLNPMFDAIIITLCLEEACKDFESLKMTIRKLANILKQGGHLILFILLDETFYKVGELKIDVTRFNEMQIKDAIKCSNLRLIDEGLYTRNPQASKAVDDYTALLGVLAQK